MEKIIERPALMPPPGTSAPMLSAWASSLCLMLVQLFGAIGYRLNRTLVADGTERMTGPLPLASYLTAARPAAASYTGCVIYVSDAGAGSKLQYSDGASWIAAG